MADEEEKQPCYVHCDKCNHEWVWVYFPMDAELLSKFKAPKACIYCHDLNSRILMGKARPNDAD